MNLKEIYRQTPDYIKTGAWIGLSAGITALVSHLLNQPELLPYYGVLNFVLYMVKEVSKNRSLK